MSNFLDARAKLNLFLRVGGKLPSGMHLLRSVSWPLDFADRVSVSPAPEGGVSIGCKLSPDLEAHLLAQGGETLRDGFLAELHSDANLAVRAARALLDVVAPRSGGLRIELYKAIPPEAGLGGGSADAAAALLGSNRCLGGALGHKALHEIAALLGSDVAQALLDDPCLMLGTGSHVIPLEPIEPVHPFRALSLLFVKPRGGVSTPRAYRALARGPAPSDACELPVAPAWESDAELTSSLAALELRVASGAGKRGPSILGSTSRGQEGIGPPFWTKAWAHLRNDFEAVAQEINPEVGEVFRTLRQLGAAHVLLTGSGSGVMGFFSSTVETEQAAAALRAGVERGWLVQRTRLV